VPARGIANGLYFISVKQGERQLVRKVVIQ